MGEVKEGSGAAEKQTQGNGRRQQEPVVGLQGVRRRGVDSCQLL